jgi:predicted phage terminase large subunit-like protein
VYEVDQIEIDRELSRRGLRYYVPTAWRWIEPSKPFVAGWHVDAICDHLQAVAYGDIQRLLISVPPGSSKSLTAGVFFPSWVWTHTPGKRFIYGAHDDTLARRDSLRTRELVKSDWYQQRWGSICHPNDDYQWSGTRFSNKEGGVRQITTIGGSIVGEHADIQIADDPHKPYDLTGSVAVAMTALGKVLEWWRSTMATRMTDIKTTARVVIAQRLVDNDLIGELLEEGGYEYLCLPMEFESARRCVTGIGFTDPRNIEGESICEGRFPKAEIQRLKKEMGPRAAQAQLQQNPVPNEGNIFVDAYFKNRYSAYPELRLMFLAQSWDCTFKKTEDGSYVVGQVWGRTKDNKYYLLDQVRGRWGFKTTIDMINAVSKKWPKSRAKLIEEKANGSAVIDMLKDSLDGLIPIEPEGGKEARANAVEPLFAANQVFIPSEELCPWIVEWERELKKFPSGKHDDQVDATTQALVYLSERKSADPAVIKESMRQLYGGL